MAEYFVYILQCADGSYYVGSTSDLRQRLLAHAEGRTATWTARRLPVRLVHRQACVCQAEAVRRERQIKGWSRTKKEALIQGDLQALKRLSTSSSRGRVAAEESARPHTI